MGAANGRTWAVDVTGAEAAAADEPEPAAAFARPRQSSRRGAP
jgi:hypothetical protein